LSSKTDLPVLVLGPLVLVLKPRVHDDNIGNNCEIILQKNIIMSCCTWYR